MSTSSVYIFEVQGHLDEHWADWLGLTIDHTQDGTTTLTGVVPDQAALHGVLEKLRDLGVTLIALHLSPRHRTPSSWAPAKHLPHTGHG
ncbi:hypothetical protein [Nocardioides mesophilus]|uniref:hypothetical protein n=1 Tax=Nocardioides mesophilus TaxID=433659 RepID=UPI001CB72A53|nr:hypothetical protein [Nocardioides mesophilus]